MATTLLLARPSWNDGTATTTYDYNEADELTAQHRSGVDRSYAYDAYGNMTSSAVASSGATSYTYDAQDRVKSLTPPSGGALTFTLDALGRHWTKSVGGTLADTYGYAGPSEAVVRIDQTSGSVSAAMDAIGNRVATATSAGGFGWSLPDLHGNFAAALGSSGSAVSDAFRYSAYGTTLAKTTSSLPSPWRYQGRLALNSDDGTGANTDLYDFVVRAYDPNLAAFTSLDSVAGSAQNPLTLNRFLYALANPATLIDPTGHYATYGDDASPFAYLRATGSANTALQYRSRPTPLQVMQRDQFNEQQAMHQAAREQHRGTTWDGRSTSGSWIQRSSTDTGSDRLSPTRTPAPQAGIAPDRCQTHPMDCAVAPVGPNQQDDGFNLGIGFCFNADGSLLAGVGVGATAQGSACLVLTSKGAAGVVFSAGGGPKLGIEPGGSGNLGAGLLVADAGYPEDFSNWFTNYGASAGVLVGVQGSYFEGENDCGRVIHGFTGGGQFTTPQGGLYETKTYSVVFPLGGAPRTC